MDETELTANQVMLVVEKMGEALQAIADQSVALQIINKALLRALQETGHLDLQAIGLQAALEAASFPPGVPTHIKALTAGGSHSAPASPANAPTLTLIEGGKHEA
jgi:hypothetical protein